MLLFHNSEAWPMYVLIKAEEINEGKVIKQMPCYLLFVITNDTLINVITT